jgi:hypothetical protein
MSTATNLLEAHIPRSMRAAFRRFDQPRKEAFQKAIFANPDATWATLPRVERIEVMSDVRAAMSAEAHHIAASELHASADHGISPADASKRVKDLVEVGNNAAWRWLEERIAPLERSAQKIVDAREKARLFDTKAEAVGRYQARLERASTPEALQAELESFRRHDHQHDISLAEAVSEVAARLAREPAPEMSRPKKGGGLKQMQSDLAARQEARRRTQMQVMLKEFLDASDPPEVTEAREVLAACADARTGRSEFRSAVPYEELAAAHIEAQ